MKLFKSHFINSILLLILVAFTVEMNAQGLLFNRLQKVEQNNPEKLEVIAGRHSTILKKNPIPYYFLSKDQLTKFKSVWEEEKQYKNLSKAIKNAQLAQKHGEKDDFNQNTDWLAHREDLKLNGYFYFQNFSSSKRNNELEKKYNLFVSLGESEFLLDSELNILFPKDEIIDTLFYGLPTGKEYIKPLFLGEEQKMLDLINEGRKKLGLSRVEIDYSLSNACRYHAYDMATQNYVDHTGYDRGKDGKLYFANSTFERIRQFYSATQVTGENISWGQKEARFVYKGWYNSTPHYKNLFKPQNNKIGVGLVHVPNSEFEYYWVFAGAE